MGDDFAWQDGDIRVVGVEQCLVGILVLAHDDKKMGIELACGDCDGKVVDIRVGACNDAGGLQHASFKQSFRAGAVAMHPAVCAIGLQSAIDDRDWK